MKALQIWEDKTRLDKLEIEFQQRIIAASRGPQDPDLYLRLFSDNDDEENIADDYVPGLGRIQQPTSTEEFENMLAQWAEEDGVDLEEFTQLFGSAPEEPQVPQQPNESERNPGNQSGRYDRYV